MKEQIENKKQSKAEYRKPEVVFAEIDPVWCNGSYDPIKGDEETPFIFL